MTLVLEQLHVGYSGFCLLSPVSLILKVGEALTITGPNGIGKSTLLATVAGLVSPLKGAIRNLFSSMLFLSCDKPIHPALTVQENLLYWSTLGGVKNQNVSQALAYFDLDVLRDEPCEHLSVGQLQRLQLCRLMITNSQLWLLDEPYNSLDEEGHNLVDILIQNHLQAKGAVLIAQTIPPSIGSELNLQKVLRVA